MTSTSYFFNVVFFLLSSLVTGPSFMSVSSLVLELWQFLFIRDWPEIRKSEIPPSEFCPISGDWGELWIPNLARMSLIECYWMLQNSRITAFTVFELLRENQLGGLNYPPFPTQINAKTRKYFFNTTNTTNKEHYQKVYFRNFVAKSEISSKFSYKWPYI